MGHVELAFANFKSTARAVKQIVPSLGIKLGYGDDSFGVLSGIQEIIHAVVGIVHVAYHEDMNLMLAAGADKECSIRGGFLDVKEYTGRKAPGCWSIGAALANSIEREQFAVAVGLLRDPQLSLQEVLCFL